MLPHVNWKSEPMSSKFGQGGNPSLSKPPCKPPPPPKVAFTGLIVVLGTQINATTQCSAFDTPKQVTGLETPMDPIPPDQYMAMGTLPNGVNYQIVYTAAPPPASPELQISVIGPCTPHPNDCDWVEKIELHYQHGGVPNQLNFNWISPSGRCRYNLNLIVH